VAGDAHAQERLAAEWGVTRPPVVYRVYQCIASHCVLLCQEQVCKEAKKAAACSLSGGSHCPISSRSRSYSSRKQAQPLGARQRSEAQHTSNR
jgi:hypothetical protein